MLKKHFFAAAISIAGFSFGQVEQFNMELNNASKIVSNQGLLFNNVSMTSHGYEVPKGSGNHILYSMGLWFGAQDIDGNIKLVAQTYTPDGDLFTGPLTNDGAATVPASSAAYGVYPVLKNEIDYHIENYDEMGYETPASILNWPAHGDVSDGVDYYLAPFVDVNGNGEYNPESGDYPKIKGDQATYIIMNDKTELHETMSLPIGLEAHFLIYEYASDDYLNNAAFINVKLINRSSETLYECRTGMFADTDIGGFEDDYMGCLASENLAFAYNGDNFDDGYGENPPAVGIKLLNRDATSIVTYNSGPGATGDPTVVFEYYNYMRAMWRDSTLVTEGGTGYDPFGEPTNYIYNGNPNNPEDWSEYTNGNISGDRRLLIATEFDEFAPGSIHCFDYVVLYSREGDYLENVQDIIDQSPLVQDFYDSSDNYCTEGFVSVPKQENLKKLKLYPNPTQGQLTVQFSGEYSVAIYALDGRLVYTQAAAYNNQLIDLNLSKGAYLVQVSQNGETYPQRLIVE